VRRHALNRSGRLTSARTRRSWGGLSSPPSAILHVIHGHDHRAGNGLSVVHEADVRRLKERGTAANTLKQGPGASNCSSVPVFVPLTNLWLVRIPRQRRGIPTHSLERLFRVKSEQGKTVERKASGHREEGRSAISTANRLRMRRRSVLPRRGRPSDVLRSGVQALPQIPCDEFLGDKDRGLIQDLGFPPRSGCWTGGDVRRAESGCPEPQPACWRMHHNSNSARGNNIKPRNL